MIERNEPTDEVRRKRNREVVSLLRKWTEEDSAEDDAAWDILEAELKTSSIQFGDPDVPTS